MASLIPGFEYDIFISYRQKDNKGDRWVSGFVDALKTELESTFKEEISVYYDENPHDGLLETHDVDASLKEKLKCLIFIPIVSRTYCDPKSFAWEHEFKAFVEIASKDQFGLRVKLPHGNVANRVLPIQIHNLDILDKQILEKELDGHLRGIEFIYKEPGVNRPLKQEDKEDKNLNRTKYNNQINKVANAIDEIITGLKYTADTDHRESNQNIIENKAKRALIKPALIASFILVLLIAIGLVTFYKKKPVETVEKSIAVLPFENMSNDPEQEFFSDGIMQEILNNLFKIGGLSVPASASSMRYKDSKLPLRQIAKELGVFYLLEGNVSKSGNDVRIIVRLINGKDELLIWTDDYKKTLTANNLLEIQSDIAMQVAENMKIVIDPDLKKRIENKPTENTEAYTLWLKAWNADSSFSFETRKTMMEKAIDLDPGYSDAYACLAYFWVMAGGHGGSISRDQVLTETEPLLKKALFLDGNCVIAHVVNGILQLYYNWDFEVVEQEYQKLKKLIPSDNYLFGFASDYLMASGRYQEAFVFTKLSFDKNKSLAFRWAQMALAYYFDGQHEKSLETIDTAMRMDHNEEFIITNNIRLLVYMEKYESAIKIYETYVKNKNTMDLMPYYLGHLGIAYYKTGNKSQSSKFLNELLIKSKKSPIGSPSYFASAIYIAMGESNKSLQLLEKAYADHEVEMYWLKVEPLFRPLHGNPQFEDLLKKIGFK